MSRTDKATQRQQLRRARQSLTRSQRRNATRRSNSALKPCIRRARRIGVYWPVGSELRLDDFVRAALARGARVYLPYIEPHSLRLWFTPYCANTAHAERARGQSRLRIPQFSGHKIRAHQLHTLIVPLVGIDRHGYRLGQGGGYYDVTLAHTRTRLRPRTIGAGFACQQVAQLPHEAHDMPLDAFVCEHGLQRFGSHQSSF